MTTSATEPQILTADSGFATLGVPALIVEHLAGRNITTPTEVQKAAIGNVLRGHDLIVQAKTGTGKTLAFGLPLLTTLAAPAGILPRALVVTPTRELCLQVATDLTDIGAVLGLRCTTVYGGQSFEPQIAALEDGVDVVVGTPGRLLDLATRGHLDLSGVVHVILDEADEMLDMGFFPDIQRLLSLTKKRTQTLLFSATMPAQVRALAKTFMPNVTYIAVSGGDADSRTVDNVTQHVFQSHNLDKPEVLARILQADGRGPTIVFCRTKMTAQRVSDDMADRGFKAAAIHGDLAQAAREKALAAFRSGDIDVLVATDVAARGIDVDGVTHVINYQTPEDAATYLHRIGRTARAGRSGTAVTLVDWDQVMRWGVIAREIGLPEQHIVPTEIYSTTPALYELLGIPAEAKGRLAGAVTKPRTQPTSTPRNGDRRSRSRSGDRHGTEQRGGQRGGESRGAERNNNDGRGSTRRPRRRSRGGA